MDRAVTTGVEKVCSPLSGGSLIYEQHLCLKKRRAIEAVQKRAVRLIKKYSWTSSVTNMQKSLKLESLKDRRLAHPCLKQINSSTANMIGYLYFNVVKMKCFVFKKEKVCSKRSWWGSCVKYKESVGANLKNPTEY
ncbi:Group 3 secretory phospholipase A2 [Nymphon striatum]|nr:Group 3 secretory phospholipase A2 [Nymphon striatum]